MQETDMEAFIHHEVKIKLNYAKTYLLKIKNQKSNLIYIICNCFSSNMLSLYLMALI